MWKRASFSRSDIAVGQLDDLGRRVARGRRRRARARDRRSRWRCRSPRSGSGAAPAACVLAGCSTGISSRSGISDSSILLRNRKCGMPRSSSCLRMSCSAGTRLASGSQTTTAASQPVSASAPSCWNSIEPGQSMKVKLSPRNVTSATLSCDAHAVVAGFGAGVADASILSATLPGRVNARRCGRGWLREAWSCR